MLSSPYMVLLIAAVVAVVGVIIMLFVRHELKVRRARRDQQYREITGSTTVPTDGMRAELFLPRMRKALHWRAVHIGALKAKLRAQQVLQGNNPYEWEKIGQEESRLEDEIDDEIRDFGHAVKVINCFTQMMNLRLPADWKDHTVPVEQSIGTAINPTKLTQEVNLKSAGNGAD